ncbi:O-methyltransferase involved in polyketide biosynthesis [Streptosporangium album]|uniref:O-methyltransferase involved in polyketide biosynthesis n=1 Tax=Streptosporangium album TaxID=47479 RepID=A0A7W7RQW3_9ACTN|nr:class I SAM-dependent methyltransferase [Streptosporangium album]MBB4936530.1 O-methyltransferase involved in polyketide biosynthesis [Streptosporangium album]
MGISLPAFTPVEDSLWLTLCGRALDNRRPRSILGDRTADEIVRKLDYDCARFKLSESPIIGIAHRAKKLDEIAANFIARHPDAVGLDLGAGLDSRMFRIAPPSTVDWYDVDFPDVITARQRVMTERANAHGIGTDLTDPDWLDALPADRPAVIVADGLLAFLAEEDMISLLNRLTGHFPSGEIAFNGYSRFAIWAAKRYRGTQSIAGLLKSPGFDDPREPERWVPGLKLVKEILLTREPEVAEFPPALRMFNRLSAHSAAWSRKGTTVLRYRF